MSDAALPPAWQQFNFFERAQVKDQHDSSLAGPRALAECSAGAIIAAGQQYVLIAEPSGRIDVLDTAFEPVCHAEAYPHGSLEQLVVRTHDRFITFGTEADGERNVKLWCIVPRRIKGMKFELLTTVTIHHEQPFPATCLTSVPDLSLVAVGFADGRVMLIKGDLVRDRGAQVRTIYEGLEPITGLEFLVSSRATALHITTTSKVLTTQVVAVGKAISQAPRVLESLGGALHCTAANDSSTEIAIARSEGIYLFNDSNARSVLLPLPGSKLYLSALKDLKAVLVPIDNRRVETTLTPTGDLLGGTRVMLLDTESHFIAYSDVILQGIRTIFQVAGTTHIVALDHRLYSLQELGLDAKLDILYSKDLYQLALSLASKAGWDAEQLAPIHMRHADYLYARKDFEGAISQYIDAVRFCNLSNVMRKFLSAQHVPLLTRFLEALHTTDRVNPEYSTLLLNCYAKLKQRDKLKKFIRQDRDRLVDLEVAVALCRQAGYYDEAISLATRHKDHAMCLGLILEDKKDAHAALKYLRRLKDPAVLAPLLVGYIPTLLKTIPSEATRLLIDFYTGAFQTSREIQATGIMSPPSRKDTTSPGLGFYESLMGQMSANRYTQALPSLSALDISALNPMRRVSATGPPAAASLTRGSPAPSIAGSSTIDSVSMAGMSDNAQRLVSRSQIAYQPPSPQTAFSMLMDYPQHFVNFLEVMLERQSDTAEGESDEARKAVVVTLLELYLKQAKSTESGARKSALEQKARKLFEAEREHIDDTSAMLVFHLTDFDEGLMLLQEQGGQIEDVFRSYCSAGDTKGAIEVLRRHGEDEPALFPLALKYFTSSNEILVDAADQLGHVLARIRERRLMAPVQVIEILGNTDVATVGAIKPYLLEVVEREKREIDSNRKVITSYREEATTKRAEARELATTSIALQQQRCSRCNATLDLPAVHFLCKHAFHQRCVLEVTPNNGEMSASAANGYVSSPHINGYPNSGRDHRGTSGSISKMECPLCHDASEAIREAVKERMQHSEAQQLFFDHLPNAKDKVHFVFSRLSALHSVPLQPQQQH
ncbi:Vacuolar protein sorting-associated protein 11 [Savitreella phatthalungensis]